MRNLGQDLHRASDTALTAGQPNGSVTAASAAHRGQIVQLPDRELDIYGNQLARCLKALGTDAPIRADIQRELITVCAGGGKLSTSTSALAGPGPGPARARRTGPSGLC